MITSEKTATKKWQDYIIVWRCHKYSKPMEQITITFDKNPESSDWKKINSKQSKNNFY